MTDGPKEDWKEDLVINPLTDEKGKCLFIHDNIDTLYHVPPTPIEDLPKVCTCGAKLTYAPDVLFVNVKGNEVVGEGTVVVQTPIPFIHIDLDLSKKEK